MPDLIELLKALSIAAFFGYGLHCLFSPKMAAEFERYGLGRFRKLVGALEVLGSLGLLAGYALPGLVPVAAGGLAILMFLGVLTRIRIRDSVAATLPAFVLMLVNAAIFARSLGWI